MHNSSDIVLHKALETTLTLLAMAFYQLWGWDFYPTPQKTKLKLFN